MKGIKYLIVSLFIVLQLPLLSQTTFSDIFGTGHRDRGLCVSQTEDNGYITGGEMVHYTGGIKHQFYLRKTDEYGQLLWEKRYYPLESSSANDIHMAGDTLIICGGVGDDACIVQLLSNGDSIHSWKSPNYSYTATANAIVKKGNGLYITGATALSQKIYWAEVYPYEDTIIVNDSYLEANSMGHDILSYSENNEDYFIIAGSQLDSSFLIKTDVSGEMMWMSKIKTGYVGGTNYSYSVSRMDDGHLLSAGMTHLFGGVLLVKTDINTGDIIWEKIYEAVETGPSQQLHGPQYAYSINRLPDGNYLIGGGGTTYTTSFGSTGGDMMLMKINPDGDSLWTRYFHSYFYSGMNGGAYDYGSQAIGTSDGGCAIIGIADPNDPNDTDFWFIKTDEQGSLVDIKERAKNRDAVVVYPNPFSAKVNIITNKDAFISISDIYGRVIHQTILKSDCSYDWAPEPDISPGIYIINVKSENKSSSRKVLFTGQ